VASKFQHEPVLSAESLAHLHLKPGAVILDGTLGGGGHASAILEATSPDGVLVGLDVDEEALLTAQTRLTPFGDRARLVRSSFRHLDRVLEAEGIDALDGVFLDLGVSSWQLDSAERGFRFSGGDGDASAENTPLDMRMDSHSGLTAAQLLKSATEPQLADWFHEYGEVRGSRRLARAIVEEREVAPLETAADLIRVTRAAGIGGGRKHNPATLVFQALRIAVNDELEALREGLDAAVGMLRPGGYLVVLAYHSLEDRIVKQRLRLEAKGCDCPPRAPVCMCGRTSRLEILTKKPISASDAEIAKNPRARSARLRAARRIDSSEAT
jgi:16S rRNA (cytosine1402-N4)-methyltransferase